MLEYAVDCDKFHNQDSIKSIVITCLDQVPENIPVTIDGQLVNTNYSGIANYLDISNQYPCYSDTGYKI